MYSHACCRNTKRTLTFAVSWRHSMSGLESEAPMIADTNPLPNADIWNKAETLDRLGDDEELLEELIQIFFTESPKLVDKLQRAVSTADADAVMRGAHSIKGELSCLG